jgi:hypothetical protein
VSQASRSPIRYVVAAYLLLQMAIPAVQLFAQHPARFGWQLFEADPRADYVLVDEVGPSTIEEADFVVASAGELDATSYLPAHLCAVVPDTREVRFVLPPDSTPTVFPCGAP